MTYSIVLWCFATAVVLCQSLSQMQAWSPTADPHLYTCHSIPPLRDPPPNRVRTALCTAIVYRPPHTTLPRTAFVYCHCAPPPAHHHRQIAAIVTSPTFPGWLAPLNFNPLRFVEFADFASMLVAAWVVAATLTGGYSGAAVGTGVPAALRAVCRAWLVAMPICAAQLVLVTVSGGLVGWLRCGSLMQWRAVGQQAAGRQAGTHVCMEA